MVDGPVDIGDTVLVGVRLDDELADGLPLEVVGRVLLAYPDGAGGRMAHVAFLMPADTSEASERPDAYLLALGAPG